MSDSAAEDEGRKPLTDTGPTKVGAEPAQPTNLAGGAMTLREHVVAKIAGLAVREVEGVHSMGRGGILEKLVASRDVRRGVKVKVSGKEATFDIGLQVEYGRNIPSVVDLVRQKVTERISAMTGLHTKDVNVEVVDVALPEEQPELKVE